MDSEAQKLISELQAIENDIISDEIIEKSIYQSIKTLEKIFGRKSIFNELIVKLKSTHKVKRLDHAIKKAIKKSKTSIERANASAIFPQLEINKNSVLTDYLADTGRISKKKLSEFHDFFIKSSPVLENAFEKGDSHETKKILKEYITILEAEKNYLKENIQDITHNIENTWSIHNLMGHEVAHWVFGELSKSKNIYVSALNEAYSFALQKLMHTFKDNYIFTDELLRKEIKQLYKLIVPRKEAYAEIQYQFMRPFILLIGILILCDSIERKNNNFQNKQLFLKSYSQMTFNGIYTIITKSIDNLKSNEFNETIKETILKTALNQLRKNKSIVISDIEEYTNELETYDKKTIIVLFGKKRREHWNNLRDSLLAPGSILNNNTRQFIASLDLLQIIGLNNEFEHYKKEYLNTLQKTLNKIIKSINQENANIFKNEKDTIKGVIDIISSEETDLIEFVKRLE